MKKIVCLYLLLSTVLFGEEERISFARPGSSREQRETLKKIQGKSVTYPFVSVSGLYDHLPMVGVGASMRRGFLAVDMEYKAGLLSSLSCSISAIQYLNGEDTNLYCSVGLGGAGFMSLFGRDLVSYFGGVTVPLRLGLVTSDRLLWDVGVELVYRSISEKHWRRWKPFPEMRFGFSF